VTLAVNTLQLLAEGYAQQLANTVDPSLHVTYPATSNAAQVGIYMAAVPTAPDQIIVLTPRPITEHPTLADAEYGLSTRYRGTTDIRTVWRIRDAVRAALAGRWPLTLPNGLEIRSIEFAGGSSLGRIRRRAGNTPTTGLSSSASTEPAPSRPAPPPITRRRPSRGLPAMPALRDPRRSP